MDTFANIQQQGKGGAQKEDIGLVARLRTNTQRYSSSCNTDRDKMTFCYKEGRLGRARPDNIVATRDELRPEPAQYKTLPTQIFSVVIQHSSPFF